MSGKNKKKDWDFKVESVVTANLVSKDLKKETEKSLKLDLKKIKPSLSRTELYQKLESEDALLNQDIFHFGKFRNRFFAFLIDAGIYLGAYSICRYLNLFKIFNLPLVIGFLAFALVLLPMRIYNGSFGKFIFKLRVRGVHSYALTFEQIFFREFVLKPFSFVLLFGFIFPRFQKKNLFFHDLAAKTIVIVDD